MVIPRASHRTTKNQFHVVSQETEGELLYIMQVDSPFRVWAYRKRLRCRLCNYTAGNPVTGVAYGI
jgi:hypothetical protein